MSSTQDPESTPASPNKLLQAAVALQACTLLAIFAFNAGPSTAEASPAAEPLKSTLPNAAAQRAEQIELLRETRDQVKRLADTLEAQQK